ncbi:MAG: hypothetical protein ABI690_36500 [Chloroflexota bacterium]
MDAFAVNRDAISNPDKMRLYFSTEIVYRGRQNFTNGDILRLGGSVARTKGVLWLHFPRGTLHEIRRFVGRFLYPTAARLAYHAYP